MAILKLIPISESHLGLELLFLFLSYRLFVVLYRLFFHPLRRFPGPKLAAASTLYRAYFQVFRDGDHVANATRLHKKYGKYKCLTDIEKCAVANSSSGPVVRISHNTLHFRNPQAFNDIYKFSTKFTKDPEFYDHLGQSEALFGMTDETEHKKRSKYITDLFSKKSIEAFEPLIRGHANRLCGLFLNTAEKSKPVNIARGFRAVALDIAQDFVYGYIPENMQGLNNERFDSLLVDTTFDVMDWTAWCFRNFPITLTISLYMPQWLCRYILPGEAANRESYEAIHKLVKENAIKPKWKRDSFLSRFMGVVPISILTSECQGTVFGGVINLANMLPYGAFCVCEDGLLQDSLFQELKSIWPDANEEIPTYEQLQALPLLSGIVKETLRFMHGIIVGPPRVVPPMGAEVDGYYVPAKSVVTTSSMYLHTDPQVFPEPNKFIPTRWNSSTTEMEQSLVPFSKGKRMCPGKIISLMELFIVFAATFRRFELEPFQTTAKDFDWKVYISLHFTGRFFHAKMIPRPGYTRGALVQDDV